MDTQVSYGGRDGKVCINYKTTAKCIVETKFNACLIGRLTRRLREF